VKSVGAADKAAVQQVIGGVKVLKSPVVSIVRFGHVAIPEPAVGNGAGTAR
jgi:hypothetical protein